MPPTTLPFRTPTTQRLPRMRGGYAFVEVMFVVAITAVVSSIVIPVAQDSISRSQTKAQDSALGEISRAKSQFQTEASVNGSPKPDSYTPLFSEIPPLLLLQRSLPQLPTWGTATFDITDPAALTTAIAGTPALRTTGGQPYYEYIASLNTTLTEPNNTAAASAQLTAELNDALTNRTNKDADWSNAVLDSSFNGKHFDYSQTNITETQLNGVNALGESNLPGLDLTGLDLTGKSAYAINFTGANNLTVAQLAAGTDLQRAKLTGTGITQDQMEATWTATGKDPSLLEHFTY